jgi:hypothetical protein
MNLVSRAAVTWLVLLVVMFANGTARVLLLQPRLGEDLARQVASLTGVAIVLGVSRWFSGRNPDARPAQLLGVGAGWLLMTLTFEFGFGRFVSHQSWETLLADYDLRAGRLWSLILVAVLVGPWLARRAPEGG